jgi:hypothetical protein
MEQLSGYEIAQKRIEQRRQKSSRFKVWIALLILAALVTQQSLQANNHNSLCTVPIMLGLGLFIFMDGIELYFTSPRRQLSAHIFEQEMTWLFGDDWQDVAGTQEYMLGQERIRRRQIRQGQFYLHLFISLMYNCLAVSSLFRYPEFGSFHTLVTLAVSLVLLIFHGYKVIPSRRRLEHQERDIGRAIQAEIAHSIPESAKHKEKPKRDVRYTIGEDGELEEISEYLIDENSKQIDEDKLFG